MRRANRTGRAPARGLAALRGGAVSDLLFLYECTTREVVQLRDVAQALGLSVQAASHTFRGLARRGLVQVSGGRYRPTVAGVDFLHGTLRGLETDLGQRLERLHIVASTRALARTELAPGDSVVLALEDGLLTARRGADGPSRGVARTAAAAGELVEIERLEGIVPLRPGTVELLSIREGDLAEPGTALALSQALSRRPETLLAVHGLEALHLVATAAPGRPVARFGIAAAVEEAARLGVSSTVVLLDRDAPQLMAQFEIPDGLPIKLTTLGRGHLRRRRT